ncbi:MAG: MFS transporter [Woeseiaceae bacterium]|nr:MFS transporter [Woeseiaceae bacterium]
MQALTDKNHKRPFYGWAITSMGALGNALQGGLIFWSMGLYTSTFEDHFGAPRAKITLIETFISIGVNVMSPLMGWLIDKRSVRHVVALGTVSMGLGLIVVSFAGTLLTIWGAFLILIPFGILSVGVLPSSALISRWFRRRRGLALGISVAGSSIGGAFAPPLLTFLFVAFGWRTAMFGTGVVVILLAPLFYRVLANYPADRGLEQEEEGAPDNRALTQADAQDWPVAAILRTPAFWMQTLISGSLLAVTLGLLANLSLHAKDLGFGGQQTALLYSVIAFCSFVGKIGFGSLVDRVGLNIAGVLTAAVMAAGLAILLFASDYTLVVAACFVIGLGTGGVSPIWTNMISRGFGARSFGRAMGVMNPLHIPITAPSAPIAGYISDTTGSYDLVFVIYIGLMAVAGTTLLLLRQPKPPATVDVKHAMTGN